MGQNQKQVVVEYDAAEIAWVDPVTGVPCLLGLDAQGLWFVGVGVFEGHPWYGVVQTGADAAFVGPHGALFCGGLTGIECCDKVDLGDGSWVSFYSERIWWVALTGVYCKEDEATILAVRMAAIVKDQKGLADGGWIKVL